MPLGGAFMKVSPTRVALPTVSEQRAFAPRQARLQPEIAQPGAGVATIDNRPGATRKTTPQSPPHWSDCPPLSANVPLPTTLTVTGIRELRADVPGTSDSPRTTAPSPTHRTARCSRLEPDFSFTAAPH